MTEKVLKTCEDFGFEDNRTQGSAEKLLELLQVIEYERFNDQDTAELFYQPLNELCIQIRQKSLWLLALETPIPSLSHWLIQYALVDVNEQNSRGYSALHFAVGQGDLILVRKLLEGGAKFNATTQHGKTALQLVEQRIREAEINCFHLTESQIHLWVRQREVVDYLRSIAKDELQSSPLLQGENRNTFFYQELLARKEEANSELTRKWLETMNLEI